MLSEEVTRIVCKASKLCHKEEGGVTLGPGTQSRPELLEVGKEGRY